MNELLLLKIITGLCVLTVLFIYVLPKFNIRIDLKQYKFTENSFKGFSSFNDFLGYFSFAFSFILKNKFVFVVPFVFVISVLFIQVLTFYQAKSNFGNYEIGKSVFDNEITINLLQYFNFYILILSIKELDNGFHGFAYLNVIGLFYLIFIFGIVYFLFKNITTVAAGKYNKIISKSLKIYFVFLFTNLLIFLFVYYGIIRLPNIFAVILVISIIIIFILEFLFIIFIQTIFEMIILVYVVGKLKNKELSLISCKQYLNYLIPLFLLNTFIGVEFILRNSVWGVVTVMSFMQFNNNLDSQFVFNFIDALNPLLKILNYIWILLFVLLFPSGFILVLNKYDFNSAIHNTLKFVLDNLVKYLFFIITGIVLMYISFMKNAIPRELIGIFSPYQPIIMTISACIKLFLVVIFYIALFKFYLDTQKQSKEKAVV